MERKKTGMYISHLRLKHHLSHEELADRLGVFEITVELWEKGILMPSICELEMLSIQLNTTVNELLAGETLEQKNDNEVFAYAEKLRNKEKYKAIFLTSLFIFSIFSLMKSKKK